MKPQQVSQLAGVSANEEGEIWITEAENDYQSEIERGEAREKLSLTIIHWCRIKYSNSYP